MEKTGKECEGQKVIKVFKKYREIFIDKPGKVKGFLGHIKVKSEKPRVQKKGTM